MGGQNKNKRKFEGAGRCLICLPYWPAATCLGWGTATAHLTGRHWPAAFCPGEHQRSGIGLMIGVLRFGCPTDPQSQTSRLVLLCHNNTCWFKRPQQAIGALRYVLRVSTGGSRRRVGRADCPPWHLPYAAYSKALGQSPDQPSPFGGAGTTPSYLTVASPDATTPGYQAPGPSPTLQLVHQKVAQDRASFLLQGRHLQLLASCGKEDRM